MKSKIVESLGRGGMGVGREGREARTAFRAALSLPLSLVLSGGLSASCGVRAPIPLVSPCDRDLAVCTEVVEFICHAIDDNYCTGKQHDTLIAQCTINYENCK